MFRRMMSEVLVIGMFGQSGQSEFRSLPCLCHVICQEPFSETSFPSCANWFVGSEGSIRRFD